MTRLAMFIDARQMNMETNSPYKTIRMRENVKLSCENLMTDSFRLVSE